MNRYLVGCTVIALAACGGGEEPAGPPAAIEDLSAAALTGTVGQQLAAPLRIRVTDAQGNGVSGVAVDFAANAGSGQVTSVPVTSASSGASFSVAAVVDSTDENGEATALWTLGTGAGEQRVSVTVAGLASLNLVATATAGPATSVEFGAGSAFIGIVGQSADGPITASVRDEFDNPVPGAAVTFTSLSAGGSVSDASGTTNDGGIAETDVGLGAAHGLYLFTVSGSGLTPDTLAVVAVTGFSDPSGDQLAAGQGLVSHDARFTGMAVFDSTVVLYTRFGQPVVSATREATQPPNALSAELDFDLDQDETTGIFPARRCVQGEMLSGFGMDLFVILDPRSLDPTMFTQGEVPVIRIDSVDTDLDLCDLNAVAEGIIVATVPVYRGNTVTLFFPLEFLATFEVFDYAAVIVTAGGGTVTDWVPDAGATTVDLAAGPPGASPATRASGEWQRYLRLAPEVVNPQYRRLDAFRGVLRR